MAVGRLKGRRWGMTPIGAPAKGMKNSERPPIRDLKQNAQAETTAAVGRAVEVPVTSESQSARGGTVRTAEVVDDPSLAVRANTKHCANALGSPSRRRTIERTITALG